LLLIQTSLSLAQFPVLSQAEQASQSAATPLARMLLPCIRLRCKLLCPKQLTPLSRKLLRPLQLDLLCIATLESLVIMAQSRGGLAVVLVARCLLGWDLGL